jgi:hypothetical protein
MARLRFITIVAASESEGEIPVKSYTLDPKPSELPMSRLKIG